MPGKERSVESKIAEHERFKTQCQRRIKPSLLLLAGASVSYILLVLMTPVGWLGMLWLVAFPLIFTSMEIAGYFRHSSAIVRLRQGT
jgi:hypothetical protein